MRIISDDGVMAQVETDDGRIVNIASQQAPGTMEYLQGIQDIKPYSGPPTAMENLGQQLRIENPMEQRAFDSAQRMLQSGDPAATEQALGFINSRKNKLAEWDQRRADELADEEATAQARDQQLQSLGLQPIGKTFTPGRTGMSDTVDNILAPTAPTTDQGVSGSREGRAQVASGSQAGGMSAFDRSYEQQFKAERQAAEIGRQKAVEEKSQHDTLAQMYQQDAEKQAALNEQRDKALSERMAMFDKTMSDYSKMEVKNPWSNASTGTKIGAALAMLVGAVGAGASGQENLAMKVINQAIDKDIDLQLKNIDKKGNELGQQKQYLEMVRNQFSDEDSRRTALRGMYLNSIESKLKSIASGSEAAMADPKYQTTIAMLQRNRETERLGLMEKQASILEKTMKAQADGQNYELLVPGFGYGLDKEATKEARKISAGSRPFIQKLDDMIEFGQKYGRSANPAIRGVAEQKIADLLVAYKQASSLGALDRGVQELGDKIFGNPTNIFQVSNLPRLKSLRDSAEKGAVMQMNQYLRQPTQSIRGPGMMNAEQKQAAAIQFIQQNPKDPRAKKLAQEMGLQ